MIYTSFMNHVIGVGCLGFLLYRFHGKPALELSVMYHRLKLLYSDDKASARKFHSTLLNLISAIK